LLVLISRVFDYKVQDIFDAGALPDNSVDVVYLLRSTYAIEERDHTICPLLPGLKVSGLSIKKLEQVR